MDYVYAVISEMERKLDRTIRDLDDVRLIMDTLKKIREQEVDMELKIDPVEVSNFPTIRIIRPVIDVSFPKWIIYFLWCNVLYFITGSIRGTQ